MNTYEGLFLIDAKLDEKSTSAIFEQIKEAITKNEGEILSARVWAEQKKLFFSIKKRQEATYYLVDFKLKPALVDKIKQVYRLNENILRAQITSGTPQEKYRVALGKKEK
ncbi:30S ribosomal protein S6 [Candidatus Omnitrophota bacterium]